MAYVTMDALYNELKAVKKEVHELRYSLIPIERISEEEHQELDEIEAEMRAGKATPWRKVLKEK